MEKKRKKSVNDKNFDGKYLNEVVSILVIQIRCNAHFFLALYIIIATENISDQSTKWSLCVQYLLSTNILSSWHKILILHQPIKAYFYL